ncbi:MAG: trehalose-phosphatase [Actinomycetes bacterium]|jgi:trehalose 6-phosphate phosphatase|nr:MAG: trehalose-phosphatase [Actinomycetota bacterium]
MTPEQAAAALASAATLLVVLDCDGTLVPITDHPSLARPNRETLTVLEQLTGVDGTHVAVVSGRPRSQLEDLFPVPGIELVGGHGSEWEGADPPVDEDDRHLLDEMRSWIEDIAAAHPGSLVEIKPASVALHYRQFEGDEASLVEQVMLGPARLPRVRVLAGKKVVELTVSRRDKGDAVRQLMERLHPDLTCYLGDDLTDEDAFAVLGPNDIGIKVGEGETRAVLRLESQADVLPFLQNLVRARALQPRV